MKILFDRYSYSSELSKLKIGKLCTTITNDLIVDHTHLYQHNRAQHLLRSLVIALVVLNCLDNIYDCQILDRVSYPVLLAVWDVLLETNVVHIKILQFWHEKVINHGFLTVPNNYNIIVGFIFEEMSTNAFLCQ